MQQKPTSIPENGCKYLQLPLFTVLGNVSLEVSVPDRDNAWNRRGGTVYLKSPGKKKITEPRKIGCDISYPIRFMSSILPEDKSYILQSEIRTK